MSINGSSGSCHPRNRLLTDLNVIRKMKCDKKIIGDSSYKCRNLLINISLLSMVELGISNLYGYSDLYAYNTSRTHACTQAHAHTHAHTHTCVY